MDEEELNFELPPSGFGSYLNGILPESQAVLAGAFATSMMQIRNIQQVNPEQFAQVVYSSESIVELPLINGTDVPTNLPLATQGLTLTALGGGVYGTYTHSNFFGCMSGLPYPLKNIYDGIKELQSSTLISIYQNMYLAVNWLPASIGVTVGGSPGAYTVAVSIPSPGIGGGYGRENSGAPSVTVNGATGITAQAIIGTNPNDLNTFGKLVNILFTGTSSTLPTGTLTIAQPTTIYGSAGWSPGMNTAIQYYIDAANTEISNIQNKNPSNFQKANELNVNWNITGTALKQEQRARYIGISPVPAPDYDKRLNDFPTSQIVFVDSLPQLAQNTYPHMSAQTLEHISNLNLTGGQSVVGMMRQERNQNRLAKVGINLDNNINTELEDQQKKLLITNGTIPGAATSEGVNALKGIYTLPAFPNNVKPVSVFDPNLPGPRIAASPPSNIIPKILIASDLGPYGDGTGPNPDGAPVTVVTGVAPGSPLAPPTFPISGPPTVTGIIPPELDTNATSSTLLPNTYDLGQAIDNVVECNCDCWIT